MPKKVISIVVCLTQYSNAPARFIQSLTKLLIHKSKKIKYEIIDVIANDELYVDNNRNIIAKKVIKSGADYSLWLDSDMEIEPDIIEHLLEHSKDIISGIYLMRGSGTVCAFRINEKDGALYHIGANWTDKPSKVDAVGMGSILIKSKVFKELEPPWFAYNVFSNYGEDLYFCKKAREKYDIWIDPYVLPSHLTLRGFKLAYAEGETKVLEK